MAVQHLLPQLVALSLIAVCCSGESDTSTQIRLTPTLAVYKLLLTGQCGFEYIQQPPSTAPPEGYNPYDQNNTIRIVLGCAVNISVPINCYQMVQREHN